MKTASEMDASSQRRRLYWQCRRGMRELDVLLQSFIERDYDRLDAAGRRNFERLLDYPDTVLLELLMGRMATADKEVADVVKRIRGAAAR